MSGFEVSTSAVAQSVTRTRAAGEQLQAGLRTVRDDVEQTLSGQWRGAAASAFDRAWDEWQAGAREVLAGLAELADLLAACEAEYAWRDQFSAQQLRVAG